MNPIARNTLAAIAGFVIGSVINLGLVTIGMSLVPLPEGTDVSTMEALRESMKFLAPVNFIFPFVAHALGTLTGAFVAAKLAASHNMRFALGIGVIFLIGGIAMILNCGGPMWFIASDLLLAYIPMAFLGGFLAVSSHRRRYNTKEPIEKNEAFGLSSISAINVDQPVSCSLMDKDIGSKSKLRVRG